jgi:hypothetical protein
LKNFDELIDYSRNGLRMNNFDLPIYLKDKDFVEPKLSSFYLLSGSGLFLVKNFDTYRSCTKIENGPPWLEDHDEEIRLRIPKIPSCIIEKIAGFFYVIYHLYQSEAIALLYFNQKDQTFKFLIPDQEISLNIYGKNLIGSYSVNYTGMPTPKGFIRIGTMHSHGDMLAFYSLTDEQDSKFDDSLNIVVGNLDWKYPSFYACFMVDGKKFKIDPFEVMEPYTKPKLPVPKSWIDKVRIK